MKTILVSLMFLVVIPATDAEAHKLLAERAVRLETSRPSVKNEERYITLTAKTRPMRKARSVVTWNEGVRQR